MTIRPPILVLILVSIGVILGSLGTSSWALGHGYSALWPALVVQVAGGIWFGGWGVLAGVLFPIISNSLTHVGAVGIFGYIPANLAQSLIPAMAFRLSGKDPAIPGRNGLLFFATWGALIPSLAGGLLGSLAVVLFGEDRWAMYPTLVARWAAPHTIVALVIGLPTMRIFTPLWRDLSILNPGWWHSHEDTSSAPFPRRFRDFPIQLKLIVIMCGLGLAPLLLLATVQMVHQGKAATSGPTPFFLTISLVVSILGVGWLSREVVRPLNALKDRVESLMEGRSVRLASSRLDEIGQVSRAFEVLLEGRLRAEESVHRSEAELLGFVQNAPYGITRASVREDRFLSVNPALVKMLGYDSEADVLRLRLSRDLYVERSGRERFLQQLSESDDYVPVELQWKRKDGRPITIRGSARLLRGLSQTDDLIIEGIEEDITQQRLMEEQLRQAQKMEAVGRLAGGVAHDFNNLLCVIQGYTELLAQRLHLSMEERRMLDAVQNATERAAALTSQLLAFSRKQVLQPRVINLNAVVVETQKMLERLIGEDITLHVELDPALANVKADPSQMTQVILNLGVNARDAMPGGGTLEFQTRNVQIDNDYLHEGTSVPAGHYVCLRVSDTGIGMDAETRSRVFEPFFTTKSAGQGTGLGLATVYGIVIQSAGHILVLSEPGHGTTFEIYLPIAAERLSIEERKRHEQSRVERAETILLVEDAPELRQLLRETLQLRGFRVLTASTGAEAITIALQERSNIALLVTDIVMPGMSGTELVQQLRARQLAPRVLYISGYAHGALRGLSLNDPNAAFLQKPFSVAALSAAVERLISGNDVSPDPDLDL